MRVFQNDIAMMIMLRIYKNIYFCTFGEITRVNLTKIPKTFFNLEFLQAKKKFHLTYFTQKSEFTPIQKKQHMKKAREYN